MLRKHGPVVDTPLGPDDPVADHARGERVTLSAHRVDGGHAWATWASGT